MAKIDELLVEVADEGLRSALAREVNNLRRNKKFGLVFEEHIPETTLLGVGVRIGSEAIVRTETDNVRYVVAGMDGEQVKLSKGEETRTVDRGDLLVVKQFGDPVYPVLRPFGDPVIQSGDKPFHTVINGENFHALQLLRFGYEGKIDCIYIDPPYNTRANDWKYNNDYVDPSDAYAHSKWLAFMQRRLRLARRLLNPTDSVLLVAIDANEVHRLGLLLEQTFPEARIRMISTLINPKGVGVTEGFKRVDEYLFVVRLGNQGVAARADVPLGSKPMDTANRSTTDNEEDADDEPVRVGVDWQTARRRDLASVRPTRRGCPASC